METYADLVAYFENFPASLPAIRKAVVGDDEEIFSQQPLRAQYPMLWVETPEVLFAGDDDNPTTRFQFALVVFTNENQKTNQQANIELSEMLALLEQVYAKVYEDAAAPTDTFSLILKNSQAAPVRRWSADNCYGWRLEITLELPRCAGCADCP